MRFGISEGSNLKIDEGIGKGVLIWKFAAVINHYLFCNLHLAQPTTHHSSFTEIDIYNLPLREALASFASKMKPLQGGFEIYLSQALKHANLKNCSSAIMQNCQA